MLRASHGSLPLRVLCAFAMFVSVVLCGCAGTPDTRAEAEVRKSRGVDGGMAEHRVREERVRTRTGIPKHP